MRHLLLAALLGLAASPVPGQETMLFPDATETVPELIDLYEQEDDQCRLSMNRDVQIAAACHARSLYGAALNERGWCYGRETEANADMSWHECAGDSMRFSPLAFDIW
ncbi:hypothetical protein [Pelagibacterium lacus]|uniref:SCP domain-containing protein n=1 Tax=Pelagibacterium lacus TaxID=2282655 RepID=A0A369W5Y1_9HYPH|nr:hypothetical protein [Pelagibacterium lacus]RDE09275.1 hypothetical protein DVH29_07400 [Pelagibacterium lacus]